MFRKIFLLPIFFITTSLFAAEDTSKKPRVTPNNDDLLIEIVGWQTAAELLKESVIKKLEVNLEKIVKDVEVRDSLKDLFLNKLKESLAVYFLRCDQEIVPSFCIHIEKGSQFFFIPDSDASPVQNIYYKDFFLKTFFLTYQKVNFFLIACNITTLTAKYLKAIKAMTFRFGPYNTTENKDSLIIDQSEHFSVFRIEDAELNEKVITEFLK